MKKLLIFIFLVFSENSLSQAVNYCGEIKRMRVWAGGGDQYGVWIEYTSNPSSCPGGFYMKHESDNKELLYSFFLSAQASKQEVCIQTYPSSDAWINGTRCRVNYGMHR